MSKKALVLLCVLVQILIFDRFYCVISAKGGLKGWTVLRCGSASRSGSKREGAKGKGQKGKATNKKQKHKAQESRHQKFLLGVSLTLCRLNMIRLEANIKQLKSLKKPKYVFDV